MQLRRAIVTTGFLAASCFVSVASCTIVDPSVITPPVDPPIVGDDGGPIDPRTDGGNPQGDGSSETGAETGVDAAPSGPTFTDGVKNGNETDTDCGGPDPGPRCAAGFVCKVHTDCQSQGCAYDGKCASHPSCTGLEGGQTCGPTEGVTKQNDCCASAATTDGKKLDKYLVTAGRMRTFLDRLNGNVRAWATALPAGAWNQAITPELPQNWDEANTQLGPFYDKRSCDTGVAPQGYSNGHVFWTPPSFGDTKDFTKEVLDTKALNCVPWWLMMAFCTWDGGHLATEAELRSAYTNSATTAYPWGAIGTYTTAATNDYAIQVFGYETPNTPATARKNVSGGFDDIAYYIAPPGRRPSGYNQTGHADLVGNLLEWVSDLDRQFIWKGSWENHADEADDRNAGVNDPYLARHHVTGAPWRWGTNVGTLPADGRGVGYYAIGGRCGRN